MKFAAQNAADRGTSMSRFSHAVFYCVSDGMPRRSLVVALIVGAVLKVINQGDALFGRGHLNLTKIILTFVAVNAIRALSIPMLRSSRDPLQSIFARGQSLT